MDMKAGAFIPFCYVSIICCAYGVSSLRLKKNEGLMNITSNHHEDPALRIGVAARDIEVDVDGCCEEPTGPDEETCKRCVERRGCYFCTKRFGCDDCKVDDDFCSDCEEDIGCRRCRNRYGCQCWGSPPQQTCKKCFMLFSEEVDYLGASNICKTRGMKLASVRSQQEHNQVVVQIQSAGMTGRTFWLGATCSPSCHAGDRSTWYWTDRTPWPNGIPDSISTGGFQKWDTSQYYQPDNYENRETVLAMWAYFGYNWNDVYAGEKFSFVCEHICSKPCSGGPPELRDL